MTPYALSEARSARTFALIGFIFFAIGTAILAFVSVFVFIPLAALTTTPGVPAPFLFPLTIPFGVFLALGVGLTIWSWVVMQDIEAGRYAKAQSPALVLGILGIFVNLISGIFFLLAYMKLGNAIQYAKAPPPTYAAAGVGTTGRYCMECGRAVLVDAKYCQHCGKPLD